MRNKEVWAISGPDVRKFINSSEEVLVFLNLFLALRFVAAAFSRCSKQGLLFLAVRRLLLAVASLVAEHKV